MYSSSRYKQINEEMVHPTSPGEKQCLHSKLWGIISKYFKDDTFRIKYRRSKAVILMFILEIIRPAYENIALVTAFCSPQAFMAVTVDGEMTFTHHIYASVPCGGMLDSRRLVLWSNIGWRAYHQQSDTQRSSLVCRSHSSVSCSCCELLSCQIDQDRLFLVHVATRSPYPQQLWSEVT